MKRCTKLEEPPTLTTYRGEKLEATWDEMRDDPFHGGQQAARDIKTLLFVGSGACARFVRYILQMTAPTQPLRRGRLSNESNTFIRNPTRPALQTGTYTGLTYGRYVSAEVNRTRRRKRMSFFHCQQT